MKKLKNKVINTGDINKKDYLLISWFITDKCNYSCSYCSSVEFNNKNKISENLNKIILFKLKKLKNDYRLDIVGGEPLLNKNLINYVKTVNEYKRCKEIYLFTNASFSNEKYIKLLTYEKILLIFSYHEEYHDPETFINKIILLNNKRIVVNVNITSINIEKTKKLINLLKKNKIEFNLNYLEDTEKFTKDKNYYDNISTLISENLEILPKYRFLFKDNKEYIFNQFDINKNNLNNFNNFYCWSNSFIFKKDKLVNECTGKEIKITTLNKKINTRIKCPLNRCDCTQMYTFYKENYEK